MERTEFQTMLADVDTSMWGQNATKTVDDLWHEVEQGEAALSRHDGWLTRTVFGVGLVLWRPADATRSWSFLMETSQTFSDGSVRYRDLEMSLGEKLVHGENAEEAVHRCLREELGLDLQLKLKVPAIHKTTLPSQSYPGTQRVYRTPVWHMILPEAYCQDEYREEQTSKTNLWHWRRLPLGMNPPLMTAEVIEPRLV